MSSIFQDCVGLQRLQDGFSFRAVANTNVTLKISPEEKICPSSDSTKPFRTPLWPIGILFSKVQQVGTVKGTVSGPKDPQQSPKTSLGLAFWRKTL